MLCYFYIVHCTTGADPQQLQNGGGCGTTKVCTFSGQEKGGAKDHKGQTNEKE